MTENDKTKKENEPDENPMRIMSHRTNYLTVTAEKDIDLQTYLPEEKKIFLLGDSRAYNQAIRNILENAINYTPVSGQVSLRVNIKQTEKSCIVQITDSGYGIPEDELNEVFTPFYRSIKHKASISGTGLGLPIARRVIEQHNGKITLSAKVNQGTIVEITQPFYRIEKKKEEKQKKKQVIIVGGITSGPRVAARLRRFDKSFNITVIEKEKMLSYAGCGLPAYILDKVKSPKTLLSSADGCLRDIQAFQNVVNINVLNRTEAVEIDRNKKVLRVIYDCRSTARDENDPHTGF